MENPTKHLADAHRGGVYQLAAAPDEIERASNKAGLAVFRIDIGHVEDKNEFLRVTAKALRFPSWFGANWDALNDCLTDLEWLPTQTGYVLVFENSELFSACGEFENAKEVLGAAAEYWKAHGRPFWAFILPRWPTARKV